MEQAIPQKDHQHSSPEVGKLHSPRLDIWTASHSAGLFIDIGPRLRCTAEVPDPIPTRFFASFGSLANRSAALFARYGAGTLEQVVIGLLNFSIVSASAKVLAPPAFAVFVVIMASLTLAFALCGAFISTPVLVLFRKRYDAGGRDYLRKLDWMNLGVCIPVCLASIGVGRIFEHKITFSDAACALFALQAWSSYELRRKTAFALARAGSLLPCSVLVLVSNLLGVLVLLALQQNHESAILLVIGLSYGAGIVLFSFTCRPPPGKERYPWKAIAADHWNFAASLVASVAFYWASSQGYFMIAAHYVSPQGLGGARTTQNLAGLIAMCVVMFENHSTPEAASIEHREGKQAVNVYIRNVYRKLSLPFLLLVFVAASIGFATHRILYRENYIAYSWLIFLFALHQFLAGASRPYAVGLKAIEVTGPIFWGYFYPALVTMSAGWIIVRQFHASGVGIGFVLSALVTLIVLRRGFKTIIL